MPEFEEDDDQTPSTRPFWSGTITFGLVSIPVNLYPANRSSHVGLRMLGPGNRPLKRKYYSEKTGKDLDTDDLVRGYEMDDGRYVVVTDEELERLAPEKSRDIDLRRFVPEQDLPRLYFDRGYFLTPAGGSAKAYRLLAETMQHTGRAGIATFVMRGKEYLIAIVADNGVLRAETLRFSDEIRSPEDIGLPAKKSAPAAAVKKFEKAIAAAATDELPRDEMRDEESAKLLELVRKKKRPQAKASRSKRAASAEPKVTDLLEVLQRTLAQAGKKRSSG